MTCPAHYDSSRTPHSLYDTIAQGVTPDEAEMVNRMTDQMSLAWYLTGATMTMEQVQHLYTLRGGRVRDAYDRLIAGIRSGK